MNPARSPRGGVAAQSVADLRRIQEAVGAQLFDRAILTAEF